jgi:hypothetical protein
MGDIKNEVVVGAETDLSPKEETKLLPAPVATATKHAEEVKVDKVIRVRCSKCQHTFVDETMNTLDERFNNAQLCDQCFDRFAKVVNDIRATAYKKWVDRFQKKEIRVFNKFLKGKYDPKEMLDGCFLYFGVLMAVILLFIGLGVYVQMKDNKKKVKKPYNQQEEVVNTTDQDENHPENVDYINYDTSQTSGSTGGFRRKPSKLRAKTNQY